MRRNIDELNARILELLQARARVVLKIADLKRQRGLERYDPRREEEMLLALTQEPSGPFGADAIRDMFRSIFHASLELQRRERGTQVIRND